MAGLKFINEYDQQPQMIRGISDNKSINALWNISLETLDPQSRAILGVLSFLSPNNVPQFLFQPNFAATSLPDSLTFCANRFLFWEAIEKFLARALVKRDILEKQQNFNNAATLIHISFPRHDDRATLYQKWDQCALLLPHVLVEAAIWHERAINHWLEFDQASGKRGTYPPSFKRSFAMSLLWSGEHKRAGTLLEHALRQVETSDPFDWALGAFTHFSLGTLDRHERKYDTSESHFLEAENMWTKGDSQRNDPFYAACAHRLGCVALEQGNLEAAIKHLSDAKMLTEGRKTLMKAEYAQCLSKLSEALQQETRRVKEAGKLREGYLATR